MGMKGRSCKLRGKSLVHHVFTYAENRNLNTAPPIPPVPGGKCRPAKCPWGTQSIAEAAVEAQKGLRMRGEENQRNYCFSFATAISLMKKSSAHVSEQTGAAEASRTSTVSTHETKLASKPLQSPRIWVKMVSHFCGV